ncbi:MAG TPA: flavodoxin domain-containing protein [Candidatus Limnocylindrales bacterium]
MRILVAYASRHGATRGIAERVATTLGARGLSVELRRADQAGDLDGFDAFVIGSAAYMGGWLGGATTLVRENRDLLANRPTWLFSSGPTSSDTVDAKGRDLLKTSEPKEFAEFAKSIRPRDARVFYGAYDPEAPAVGTAEKVMSGFMRVLPAARNALPAGDFRDWPAIEAWAKGIADELASARVTALA